MKKIILMTFVAMTSLTVYAQSYIGGSIGFGVSNTQIAGKIRNGGTTTTTFGIAPEFGYNFNEKVAVGMSVGAQNTSVMRRDNITDISVDPYFRYKVGKAGPFTFFGDVVAEWESTITGGESSSSYGIGLRPGVSVDLSKNWSAAATTVLLSHKYWANEEISQTQFNIAPCQLSVGFYYNF